MATENDNRKRYVSRISPPQFEQALMQALVLGNLADLHTVPKDTFVAALNAAYDKMTATTVEATASANAARASADAAAQSAQSAVDAAAQAATDAAVQAADAAAKKAAALVLEQTGADASVAAEAAKKATAAETRVNNVVNAAATQLAASMGLVISNGRLCAVYYR